MKNAILLLADGFEEVEAATPADFLRRCGAHVALASLAEDLEVKGSHGLVFKADKPLSALETGRFDAVVLPGGLPGSQNLADDGRVIALLNRTYAAGGVIGAICAAPAYVLPKTDFFAGLDYTCNPSVASRPGLHADNYIEAPAVLDRRLVTSQGPGTAGNFAHALISELFGASHADKALGDALYRL